MSENTNEFKKELSSYLASTAVGTNDLRAYARVIGVKEPTKKVKKILIEEIVAILAGELAPVPISTRGAPVKNDYIKPAVLKEINRICAKYKIFEKYEKKTVEDDYNPFDYERPKEMILTFEDGTPSGNSGIYTGQLTVLNGAGYLLPVNCMRGENILISDALIAENGLREGDVVGCLARMGESVLLATKVLTVNDLIVGSFDRTRFEEEIPCYPREKIDFLGEEGEHGVALKYFDWISPIGRGQRACIVSPPKAGKSELLYEMAIAAKKCDRNARVFVLLIDQSPETVGRFRRAFSEEELIYTTYEDDADKQVFAAEFMLKRAKRYVEHKRNVLLFIDSLSALARAYNETEFSMGGKTLAGGMESKTLQYIKRYLGTARHMEKGGSLTIVGAVAADTGNPADELICSELTAVANLEIHLSGELSARRIYPAIDPMQTRTGDGTNGTEADGLLRGRYLPKRSVEDFLGLLAESDTKEIFIKKLSAEMEK